MTYTREFFGVEHEEFDLEAASAAYDWVMAHYDVAPFVVSKALFDTTTADLALHRAEVNRVVSAYMAARTEDLKRGMVRELITKAAADQPIDAMAQAAEMVALISKAGQYTPWERERNAEKQLRDAGGRFRVMNRRIQPAAGRPEIKGSVAIAMGIPDSGLKGEKKAEYQTAYLQVRDALRELDASGMGDDIMVQGVLNNGDLTSPMRLGSALDAAEDATNADNGLVRASHYDAGQKLSRITAEVHAGRGSSNPTQAFDVLTGMQAAPGFAMFATGTGRNLGAGLDEFANPESGWNSTYGGDVATNERFWRRTQAAAKLAETVGGKYLPPKAKLALATAQWAGEHAPQAEEVLGPTARKSAYRYRGVEKQPDPIFQKAINDARATFGTGREAHDFLIQGRYLPTPKGKGKPGQGVWEDKQESPLIEAMRRRLPDKQLYELNRKAGTIPPSQGIIIDRSGKVVTEAMGYGDDWYLPFNLKNMNRLRGGEYIRTRAYGGPTTEDIYAGMVSGARAVTVVSHSGVFHVEFDDTFRGNRRYNDKAARMVKRYGMLLDAVKSRQVTMGDIPADKKVELRQKAAADWDPDEQPREYKAEFERLMARERENPTLSQRRVTEIKQGLLDEWARDRDAPDFSTWLVRERDLQTKRALASGYEPEKADEIAASMIQAKYDPANLDTPLASLGLDAKAARDVDAAQAEYKASMSPLQLDGEGYQKALEALRDQFPYYFADPYYEPVPTKTDKGYVKPGFNRPAGALAGYYDRSIQRLAPSATETGKFTADQLNYQNGRKSGQPIRFRPVAGQQTRERSEAEGPREERKTPGVNVERAKNAELMAVVRMVREAKGNPNAPGIKGTSLETFLNDPASGGRFGAASMDRLRAEFPLVYDRDLESKLAADPALRVKLGEQLDRLRASEKVLFDEDVWNEYKSAGGAMRADTVPVDKETGRVDGDTLAATWGKAYDFEKARPGRTPEAYTEALKAVLNKQGVRDAFTAAGIEPPKPTDGDDIIRAALDAAAKPIRLDYEEHEKKDAGFAGARPKVPVPTLEKRIHGLSEALAVVKARSKAAKPAPAEPAPAAEAGPMSVHFHVPGGAEGSTTPEFLTMMESVMRGGPYNPAVDPNVVPGEVVKPRSLGT